MANTYPQLVAFDLDYTLWDLWVDTHVQPPIRRKGNELNRIYDRNGNDISLYHEVPSILHRLRFAGTTIAACSRTTATELAREALSLLLMPPSKAEPDELPKPAIEYFDQAEIYPGSKKRHFKALHEQTGIPYSEMLFFDDEYRNKEVEQLGVTFCLVERGVDEATFEAGLTEWRRRHAHEEAEADAKASESKAEDDVDQKSF